MNLNQINKKVNFLPLFVIIGLSSSITARAKVGVKDLLGDISKNSLGMKVVKAEEMSKVATNNINGTLFDTTGYLSASYYEEDTAPRSPFSTDKTQEREYEIGVSKLWSFGITSSLSYNVSEVSNSFINGSTTDFISPQLELSLSSNLVQDLIYGRYKHLKKESSNNKKVISLKSKVDKKVILVQSLLDFMSILKNQDDLAIQNQLCFQTKKQSKKLKSKSKRGSISKREYYLSLRELTLCEASVNELEKSFIEDHMLFNSNYSVSFAKYKGLSLSNILAELENNYRSLRDKGLEDEIKNTDDIKYLDGLVQASKDKQAKLDALKKSNLALELSTGVAGLQDSFSDANTDLEEINYPYLSLSLTMDLPFSNREAKLNAAANQYTTRALEEQKNLSISKKVDRLKTLNLTFDKDFSLYKKYLKSLKLSQDILREARSDFEKGKIDYYGLTEFNKSLISDQQILSEFRQQLIIKIVEYLDFNNYFNNYL